GPAALKVTLLIETERVPKGGGGGLLLASPPPPPQAPSSAPAVLRMRLKPSVRLAVFIDPPRHLQWRWSFELIGRAAKSEIVSEPQLWRESLARQRAQSDCTDHACVLIES